MNLPVTQTPRFIAGKALEGVIFHNAFSGQTLDLCLQRSRLEAQDVALTTELFYGVLRWKPALEQTLKQACKNPKSKIHKKLLPHLLVAAYQLGYLQDRIPSYAAVNEALRCIKKVKAPLTGFANAVLRNLKPPEKLDEGKTASMQKAANVFGFDVSILETVLEGTPPQETIAACQKLNERPSLTVRAQGNDADLQAWSEALQEHGVEFFPHPWYPQAFVFQRTGKLTQVPGFEAGRFWVQDAASQLCALLCQVKPDDRVVDLCAAPGGKSLILQSQLGPKQSVTSVEIAPHKEARMLENRARMNLPFTPVIADALTYAEDAERHGRADVVLLDAPCSATGTFRRHPEIKWQKSRANALEACLLQGQLLESAARLVKSGGRLVYSVCSLFPEEGPAVVQAFLQKNQDFTSENAKDLAPYLPDTAVEADGWVRLRPHLHDADGFFMAALKKR